MKLIDYSIFSTFSMFVMLTVNTLIFFFCFQSLTHMLKAAAKICFINALHHFFLYSLNIYKKIFVEKKTDRMSDPEVQPYSFCHNLHTPHTTITYTRKITNVSFKRNIMKQLNTFTNKSLCNITNNICSLILFSFTTQI